MAVTGDTASGVAAPGVAAPGDGGNCRTAVTGFRSVMGIIGLRYVPKVLYSTVLYITQLF